MQFISVRRVLVLFALLSLLVGCKGGEKSAVDSQGSGGEAGEAGQADQNQEGQDAPGLEAVSPDIPSKIDISKVKVPATLNDDYFKKPAKAASKKSEGEFFQESEEVCVVRAATSCACKALPR